MAHRRGRSSTIARLAAVLAAGPLVAACTTTQSAIHPAGEEAEAVATLFWWMTGAGALIWLIVIGITVYAVVGRKRPQTELFADRFILVGGVIFPGVVLAALLVFGLSLLPSWTEDEPADLRISVVAEQFWWRVTYTLADGTEVETANEVHLPVNQVAEFVIDSPDVIHSFWIPSLGGKMDAIPGRTNVLRLHPTKTGTYRGVCAEFCGPSHALMAFVVEVHDDAGFSEWLNQRAAPATARSPVFESAGCGACHTIRGVSEQGSIGPDLTHFGARTTLAAATLDNTPETLRLWLSAPEAVKPGARMPGYHMLDDGELDALVAYLMELR